MPSGYVHFAWLRIAPVTSQGGLLCERLSLLCSPSVRWRLFRPARPKRGADAAPIVTPPRGAAAGTAVLVPVGAARVGAVPAGVGIAGIIGIATGESESRL